MKMDASVEEKIIFAPLPVLYSNPVVFEVLLCICKLDWILNFSSCLKYLATNLQTNISISKNKDCPWISLEETIPGPAHYPDGSQTAGSWTLDTHLTDEKRLHLTSGPLQMLGTSKSNRLGREVVVIRVDCFCLRCQIKISYSTWNTFSFFFFPLLWHWPGKIMPSSISPRPLLMGVNFQGAGFVIKHSHLSMMLETPWSISLSAVNIPNLGKFGFMFFSKKGTQGKISQNKTACVVHRTLEFTGLHSCHLSISEPQIQIYQEAFRILDSFLFDRALLPWLYCRIHC